MAQIQRLVHEGSVRRVIVKHPDGHTIVEFPLLVGVVGAASGSSVGSVRARS